ncbi:hypothetical protein [Streptomyces erythrochromogenes]|uniref:hypothetical protein n=1 Tax=Streptomyces erythrochromogenes TaxID=285574 RepID=UPI00386C9447|nr:hypothetical protein OG489_30990 [Streptomyces erythrochromogenes]
MNRRNRRNVTALALLGALTLVSGCTLMDSEPSSERSYDPQPRAHQDVQKEVGDLSSRALDMTQVKGKVTDGGPATYPCGSDEEKKEGLRNVRHVWSVYGVDDDALDKGMQNLAAQLPGNGWKVVKNGPNENTESKQIEVLAVHEQTHTQLEAKRMDGSKGGETLIYFDVYSRCFKDTDAK